MPSSLMLGRCREGGAGGGQGPALEGFTVQQAPLLGPGTPYGKMSGAREGLLTPAPHPHPHQVTTSAEPSTGPGSGLPPQARAYPPTLWGAPGGSKTEQKSWTTSQTTSLGKTRGRDSGSSGCQEDPERVHHNGQV